MLNHKITDILKTFSTDDIKKFREYLDSPIFNKNNTMRKLYIFMIVMDKKNSRQFLTGCVSIYIY
ncbi:MAG: hypothetical protein WAT71_12615 [Ignavibacteria bacterium]